LGGIMRALRIIAITGVVLALIVGFLWFLPTVLNPQYFGLRHKGARWYADFTAACDAVLAAHPPGTNEAIWIPVTDLPVTHPVALRWGDKTRIRTVNGEAQVEAFEVKHWGARWRHDTYRGYNGYIIAREGRQLLFGGDTAWTESFRPLRGQGPYEFAIMPIGAYQPWICSHCTPEQAVRMANDAGARSLLPVHFKTFAFGREGTLEPMARLRQAIEPERIGWSDVGETFVCAGT
jgi:L-ascorbate metabolism protein UlaG (beta-lactamase superfamily)